MNTSAEMVEIAPGVIALTPVVASYAAYDGSMTLSENASMVMDFSPDLYSEEITAEELKALVNYHNGKFHEPWKYMGTRDGFHYLALYPFLNRRQIYRIPEEEYAIDEPFKLTSRSSGWRDILAPDFGDEVFHLVLYPTQHNIIAHPDPYAPNDPILPRSQYMLVRSPDGQYHFVIRATYNATNVQGGLLQY